MALEAIRHSHSIQPAAQCLGLALAPSTTHPSPRFILCLFHVTEGTLLLSRDSGNTRTSARGQEPFATCLHRTPSPCTPARCPPKGQGWRPVSPTQSACGAPKPTSLSRALSLGLQPFSGASQHLQGCSLPAQLCPPHSPCTGGQRSCWRTSGSVPGSRFRLPW